MVQSPMCIRSKSYYILSQMFMCPLLLPMTRFVYDYIPPCEISEGITCVFANSYFVYLSYRLPSLRNLIVGR